MDDAELMNLVNQHIRTLEMDGFGVLGHYAASTIVSGPDGCPREVLLGANVCKGAVNFYVNDPTAQVAHFDVEGLSPDTPLEALTVKFATGGNPPIQIVEVAGHQVQPVIYEIAPALGDQPALIVERNTLLPVEIVDESARAQLESLVEQVARLGHAQQPDPSLVAQLAELRQEVTGLQAREGHYAALEQRLAELEARPTATAWSQFPEPARSVSPGLDVPESALLHGPMRDAPAAAKQTGPTPIRDDAISLDYTLSAREGVEGGFRFEGVHKITKRSLGDKSLHNRVKRAAKKLPGMIETRESLPGSPLSSVLYVPSSAIVNLPVEEELVGETIDLDVLTAAAATALAGEKTLDQRRAIKHNGEIYFPQTYVDTLVGSVSAPGDPDPFIYHRIAIPDSEIDAQQYQGLLPVSIPDLRKLGMSLTLSRKLRDTLRTRSVLETKIRTGKKTFTVFYVPEDQREVLPEDIRDKIEAVDLDVLVAEAAVAYAGEVELDARRSISHNDQVLYPLSYLNSVRVLDDVPKDEPASSLEDAPTPKATSPSPVDDSQESPYLGENIPRRAPRSSLRATLEHKMKERDDWDAPRVDIALYQGEGTVEGGVYIAKDGSGRAPLIDWVVAGKRIVMQLSELYTPFFDPRLDSITDPKKKGTKKKEYRGNMQDTLEAETTLYLEGVTVRGEKITKRGAGVRVCAPDIESIHGAIRYLVDNGWSMPMGTVAEAPALPVEVPDDPPVELPDDPPQDPPIQDNGSMYVLKPAGEHYSTIYVAPVSTSMLAERVGLKKMEAIETIGGLEKITRFIRGEGHEKEFVALVPKGHAQSVHQELELTEDNFRDFGVCEATTDTIVAYIGEDIRHFRDRDRTKVTGLSPFTLGTETEYVSTEELDAIVTAARNVYTVTEVADKWTTTVYQTSLRVVTPPKLAQQASMSQGSAKSLLDGAIEDHDLDNNNGDTKTLRVYIPEDRVDLVHKVVAEFGPFKLKLVEEEDIQAFVHERGTAKDEDIEKLPRHTYNGGVYVGYNALATLIRNDLSKYKASGTVVSGTYSIEDKMVTLFDQETVKMEEFQARFPASSAGGVLELLNKSTNIESLFVGGEYVITSQTANAALCYLADLGHTVVDGKPQRKRSGNADYTLPNGLLERLDAREEAAFREFYEGAYEAMRVEVMSQVEDPALAEEIILDFVRDVYVHRIDKCTEESFMRKTIGHIASYAGRYEPLNGNKPQIGEIAKLSKHLTLDQKAALVCRFNDQDSYEQCAAPLSTDIIGAVLLIAQAQRILRENDRALYRRAFC